MVIDSAANSSKAGERTRRRKRAVCVGEVGNSAATREEPGLAMIVAIIVVVAVLDGVGCGGRDRKKQRRKGRGGREQTRPRGGVEPRSYVAAANNLGGLSQIAGARPKSPPTVQTNANREIAPNV